MTVAVKTPPAALPWTDPWVEITPGERFRVRTSGEETSGIYSVIELVAEPRNGVPMHIHGNEDEHFLVLEGMLHMAIGDERLDVPAGATATVKRGVAHAWCNLSNTPVRMLLTFSPARIEGMFMELGARQSDDLKAIAAWMSRYGTVIVGPPIAEGIHSLASPRRQ